MHGSRQSIRFQGLESVVLGVPDVRFNFMSTSRNRYLNFAASGSLNPNGV